ncbi:MAG: hypothetical protein ACPK7O_06965 [Methanobacterium sp.]
MIKIILKIKNNLDIIIAIIIYVSIGLILLNQYQYAINPDGISYINIAQVYLSGNWHDALNGYWGPLFSWLLTPLLQIGFNGVFASKILSLTIGAFSLIGLNRLFYVFNIDLTIKRIMLIAFIPIILFFSLSVITPDLLITCIFLYYLCVIFDQNYTKKWYYGALCGFIGTMAYLGKSYALPFFLAHFILFNVIYFLKKVNVPKRKSIYKNLLIGLSVFFILSGLWIGLISDKYSAFTFGTSASYNQALVGPEPQYHPMYYEGLFTPPYAGAISSWTDPSYFKFKSWNALKSPHHQLEIIRNNFITLYNIIQSFSVLAWLIIILSGMFLLSSFKNDLKEKLLYLLITMLIYSGGYCLVLLESRYIWLVYILLGFTGAYIINAAFKTKLFNKHVKTVLAVILALSFISTPVTEIMQYDDSGKEYYIIGQQAKFYGVHGNIASNTNWDISLYIVYYLNAQYYGITKKTDDPSTLASELKSNNIQYYFVWGSSDPHIPGYMEITNCQITDLKIYSAIK